MLSRTCKLLLRIVLSTMTCQCYLYPLAAMLPNPRPVAGGFSILFLLLFQLQTVNSIAFNLSSFGEGDNITLLPDAYVAYGVIELTKNFAKSSSRDSAGRAFYNQPVQLWDPATRRVTDFATHFSFKIEPLGVDSTDSGDGFGFFLAANGSHVPINSRGGGFALFNTDILNNVTNVSNPTVAVEFDTYLNTDWDSSSSHVGIDINSVVSMKTQNLTSAINNGSAEAWVRYNATTMLLSVILTYQNNDENFSGNSSLDYLVDLSKVLPPLVYVGFSASTGWAAEINRIISWDFTSNLYIAPPIAPRPAPAPAPPPIVDNEGPTSSSGDGIGGGSSGDGIGGGSSGDGIGGGALAGVVIGSLVLLGLFAWLVIERKRKRKRLMAIPASNNLQGKDDDDDAEDEMDLSMDNEFEHGTGAKRFTYQELASATDNFSEDGKLGEGSFGGVYKGFLKHLNTEVAVKRVSKSSKQGRKEYASEVRIISRLRHRNLVQLIGWCHRRREFLLVYEFLHNGSLDSHLFDDEKTLTNILSWATRHKIANGLASALLYLHEEWEQCVVHRDIKSSNVMLDSAFNAKLGDFGLARLVDHGIGSQTTLLAGTLGYLAPECLITGKSSKESDVFSFGIVALEIACGRKAIEHREVAEKVMLVEWAWDSLGKGAILECVDGRLGSDYDEKEVGRLMVVGLWCAHPNFRSRPSMRQVITVLSSSDTELPILPAKMPQPMYSPPANVEYWSSNSSVTTVQRQWTDSNLFQHKRGTGTATHRNPLTF